LLLADGDEEEDGVEDDGIVAAVVEVHVVITIGVAAKGAVVVVVEEVHLLMDHGEGMGMGMETVMP